MTAVVVRPHACSGTCQTPPLRVATVSRIGCGSEGRYDQAATAREHTQALLEILQSVRLACGWLGCPEGLIDEPLADTWPVHEEQVTQVQR